MNENIKNINYTYLFILATVSFLWFMLKEHTAYDWPAIDMMPFFERHYDSYFLKVILTIFTPIFYYLFLYFSIAKFIESDKLKNIQTILLLAILIVIYPRFSGIFSITWWKPYFIQTAAQNISIFFGLFAIISKEINWNSKYSDYISIFFFALATLMHPAIGLFIIIFYLLINFKLFTGNIQYIVSVFIGGFLLPAIIIKIVFSPEVPLSTMEFVNIYIIENHSSHYHLENFGTHTPVSWIYSFILMFGLLIIPIGGFDS